MRTTNIQKAYPLVAGVWTQIEPNDASRRGTIFQNQSANSPNSILVSQGRPTTNFAALELPPNAVLYEDILPPNGELWAYCAANATLTLVVKY